MSRTFVSELERRGNVAAVRERERVWLWMSGGLVPFDQITGCVWESVIEECRR